jgi:hypothetical protein
MLAQPLVILAPGALLARQPTLRHDIKSPLLHSLVELAPRSLFPLLVPLPQICCASKYFVFAATLAVKISIFLAWFSFFFSDQLLTSNFFRLSSSFTRKPAISSKSSSADCLLPVVHQTKLAKIGNRCQRHFPPRSLILHRFFKTILF